MKLPLFIQRRINKEKPPLKVYWYRYRYPEKMNFGDEVTPYIITKLWGRECEWASPDTCELVGAGSVIEVFQKVTAGNIVRVWGSGFIKDGPENENAALDFYAVRGQWSLSRVSAQHPIALGDPALLANRVFKPAATITHKVGVVAHYVDVDHPALHKIRNDEDYLLIDPLWTPAKVAEAITACEFIVSSSLHGLIFADSYGVPNYWMPLSDKVVGGSYKFEDYYSATNRELIKKSPSILGDQKAVEKAIQSYRPVKNLKKLQRGLIKSFPF